MECSNMTITLYSRVAEPLNFHLMNTFLEDLTQEVKKSPANSNPFFQKFKDDFLTREQLQIFARNYFVFCREFIPTLAGLIFNMPMKEEDIRLELVKTLYSEMGYGNKKAVHLNLLKKFTDALGLNSEELMTASACPKIQAFNEGLRDLFVKSDYRVALGAEFAIEIIAAPEFTYLYPGVKKYKEFSDLDIIFFKFHLEEEQLHGDWLTEAVKNLLKTDEEKKLVWQGAHEAVALWGQMWEVMMEEVFQKT